MITKEFIQKQYVLLTRPVPLTSASKIDVVCHGDDFDANKIKLYYAAPMEMGIFRTIPYARVVLRSLTHRCRYTQGISTTEILRRIKSYQEQGILAKV